MLRDSERFEEIGNEPEPGEGQRVIVTIGGRHLGTGTDGTQAISLNHGGVLLVRPEDAVTIRVACPGCEDGDWQADFCDECQRRGIDADTDRVADDGGRDSIIRLR